MKKEIYLCAINNLQSGACTEDCKFCAQSLRYGADIDRYGYKSLERILKEAHTAKKVGAVGYCLVTSGRGLSDSRTEYIAKVASALKKSFEELFIIACNGIASLQQLRYLKEHGVDSYNHNLETSREYYPQICTTHGWEERYATCEAVKSAGLALCIGGIFGMGESSADRESLLRSIESLEPEAVPLNFYLPNPALPLKESDIDADEALEIVRKSRACMGERGRAMVAGGRERLFAGREEELFEAGANSIVIGDYLTTKGREARSDLQLLASLGYEIATSCHE